MSKRGLSRDPLAGAEDPFSDIGSEAPKQTGEKRSQSAPQRFVRQVVYLDPADARWVQELQAGALLEGERVPAGLVLRTALRLLRDRGRDWPALRALLEHQAKIEPGAGRPTRRG